MHKNRFIGIVAMLTLSVVFLVGCASNSSEGSGSSQVEEAKEELSKFEQWTSAEKVWPEWAEPMAIEISADIKSGPSVRKTFAIEDARNAVRVLRYLVENTEPTEDYPYYHVWKEKLGTGLLQLGEYQLAYSFLNDVYNLPDDAMYGTDKVDGQTVIITKADEEPNKILHGRLMKAISKGGFSEEVLALYGQVDYSKLETISSWGLTSAAWAMKNIGMYEEAYKLFDLSYKPEPFGEERPYQAASNILAAASFAYHEGNYEKVLEYTERIVTEGVEPVNLAYFVGQDLESERKGTYFKRHWKSSYEIAEGLQNLAKKAVKGKTIDFDNLKDGTYTASNTGYMLTPINVELTIENGKITSIIVDQPGETDDRTAGALHTIPNQVIETGGLKIDSISSATITSESLKLSIAEALLQATKGKE